MHTNLNAVACFIASIVYPIAGVGIIVDEGMRCDALYNTIDTLLFSDNQKADLYARLAEGLTPTTEYADAMKIIKHAIYVCQEA